jgi:hypothetical protein
LGCGEVRSKDEVEVGLWRGLCEDEVEGRAGSSWLGAAGGGGLGRAVPVGGSSGGGRKAAVAQEDAGWSLTSASVRVQPKVSLNLPWEQTGGAWQVFQNGASIATTGHQSLLPLEQLNI